MSDTPISPDADKPPLPGRRKDGRENDPALRIPEDALANDLLAAYLEDVQHARARSLAEYQALFPGHDDFIAAEIERLKHAPHGTLSGPAGQPESPALGPETPDRIGPYRILDTLGEGGMGTVYLAEQNEPVRRRVALKVIKPGMATKEVLARFEAERQALALMSHPNISRVFDAGMGADERPYFVMEHVPGVALTDYCDRQKLELEERLSLLVQVCQGIQHAHQKGIIHRDIKPSNVLVQLHDGTAVPKIIDFGVAKALDHRLTERTLFTEQGQIIGTPEYMSPEQAEMTGLNVDTRTDVYSLGVLMYELLVGALPFDRDELRRAGFAEIQRRIRDDDPPRPSTRVSTFGDESTQNADRRRTDPRALVRRLRGELDWITMKALEKDPTRRYQAPSELAADIERYLNHDVVVAGPPSGMYRLRKMLRRYRGPVAATASVLLTLAAGLVVSIRLYFDADDAWRKESVSSMAAAQAADEARAAHGRVLAERDAKERANARLKEALEHSEGLRLAALSEVARSEDPGLALILGLESHERLPGLLANNAIVQAWSELHELRSLVGHRGVVERVALSPDDKIVLTASEDETAVLWDAASGRMLAELAGHDGPIRYASFSPDGSRVVTASNNETTIRVWDVASGQLHTRLEGHQPPAGSNTLWGFGGPRPFFGLDRDHVWSALGVDSTIRLWNAKTGAELRKLSVPEFMHWELGPLRRRALLVDPDVAVIWDLEKACEVAKLDWSGSQNWIALDPASFSADGQLVLPRRGRTVPIYDTENGQLVARLGSETNSYIAASFSPTGKHVVTFSGDRVHVWNGTEFELVSTFEGDGPQHAWSPNGLRLAARKGSAVHVWDLPGGKPLAVLRGHLEDVQHLAFTRDGRRLVTGDYDGQVRIWSVRTRASELILDGAVVAMASELLVLSRGMDAVLWDSGKRRPRAVLTGHTAPMRSAVISVDGATIVTVSSQSVRVWDATTGKQLRVFEKPQDSSWTLVALRPDGQQLVTFSGETVVLWDVETGERVATTKVGDGRTPIHSITWVGGRIFLTDGNQVWRWLGGTGERVRKLQFGGSPSQIILANSLLAITSSYGHHDGHGYLRVTEIRDRRTWSVVRTLPGPAVIEHRNRPFVKGLAAFAPDDKRIVTASTGSRLAIVWEIDTGKQLFVLRGHTEFLQYVAYSPDGSWILTSSKDGTVRLWDAGSGEEVVTLPGFYGRVQFTPDSRWMVTPWRDGQTRLWPVDFVGVAESQKPRELTPRERVRFMMLEVEHRGR